MVVLIEPEAVELLDDEVLDFELDELDFELDEELAELAAEDELDEAVAP